MYLDRTTWRTLVHLTFRRRRTLRHLTYFVGSQALFFAVRSVVSVGRRLDDLLYPAHAQEPIPPPLFVFASARSGSTLLHRLLSLDEERFTTLRLYQTLCQSVTLTRVIEAWARLDAQCGRPLRRLVTAAEDLVFSRWKGIHPVRLGGLEEDEGYFVFSLMTPGLYVFYPFVAELEGASWLDRASTEVRRRVMQEYRSNVQRHLFATGRGRMLLNKTVLLAGRVESILQTFPDARFVHLLRHPYESLPSFVSMFHTMWSLHSPDIQKDSPTTRQLGQLWLEYFQRGLETRDRIPPERLVTIEYPSLVADPRAAIERIYAHFGWELSPEFATRLDRELAVARRHHSEHRYSLEEYGLTREQIQQAVPRAFAELGFSR